MPQVVVSNVTLVFTQCMLNPSEFGGYNYSFIINSEEWCKTVRTAIHGQKTKLWDDDKNTDEFILSKTCRSRDDVKYDTVKEMMKEDDVLVQVKATHPIENTKDVALSRGSTANVLIDIFEYIYAKKQFICVKSHPERGCTVQPINVVEYADSMFFKKETENGAAGTDKGLAADNSDVESEVAQYLF